MLLQLSSEDFTPDQSGGRNGERPAFTMKDLPPAERPYERLWEKGADALSDAELLAIILRSGRSGESSIQMARRLLYESPGSETGGNLRIIFTRSPQELAQIDGIGRVKAIQIAAVRELASRLVSERLPDSFRALDPSAVADHYYSRVKGLQKEHVFGIWLDNRLRYLGDSLISVGTVNHSVFSIRDVFLEALRFKAVHFILLHNHPSGDPVPSENDLEATARIRQAAELIQIMLIDHIVIGDNRFYSFKEDGLL